MSARSDARHAADTQLAGAAVGERGDVGSSRFEVTDDRIGVGEQLASGFGQLDEPARRVSG